MQTPRTALQRTSNDHGYNPYAVLVLLTRKSLALHCSAAIFLLLINNLDKHIAMGMPFGVLVGFKHVFNCV